MTLHERTTLLLLGPGQIGRWLASGALAEGLAVIPFRRGRTFSVEDTRAGEPILVAVPESELSEVVATIPQNRRRDCIFVQNDLFPHDVSLQDGAQGTFLTVWVNRKAGLPEIVGNSSAACGPHAATAVAWIRHLGVDANVLNSADALRDELAAKWAFLLVVNALGLAGAETVGDGMARFDVERLVTEALALAPRRAGAPIRAEWAGERVVQALQSMRDMPARGRSAGRRVAAALALASAEGEAPALFELERRAREA